MRIVIAGGVKSVTSPNKGPAMPRLTALPAVEHSEQVPALDAVDDAERRE
jgi:hypothetical protein